MCVPQYLIIQLDLHVVDLQGPLKVYMYCARFSREGS